MMYCYYYYMCLANYGANEAVNLCCRYVEKSTQYSEQKCASYFLETKIICSLAQVRSDLHRISKTNLNC